MDKIRLTKRSVEAIKPAARDMVVWDTDIPGFGVKVTPRKIKMTPQGERVTGGARVYILQYSRRNKDRRVTIGRHGDGGFTAEQARGEAEILRGIIRHGGDPAADRARERAIPTMRVLAERYMAEHAIPKKKPRSADGDRRLIDCHVLPLLGEQQVSEIGRAELRRLMQDVAAGKTALDLKTGKRGRRIVRGGKGAANRCLTLLTKMFALAEDWGYRSASDGNPCRGVERFDESAGRQRARFLSDAQLARLGAALAAAEAADPRHRMPANIVRLLLLTGARMGEIVGLRREYLDLGRGLIRLPDSKTGAKPIVLSAPARQLLAELAARRRGKRLPVPWPPAGKRHRGAPLWRAETVLGCGEGGRQARRHPHPRFAAQLCRCRGLGRVEPVGDRRAARPFAVVDDGTLCTPGRRSGAPGGRRDRQPHRRGARRQGGRDRRAAAPRTGTGSLIA